MSSSDTVYPISSMYTVKQWPFSKSIVMQLGIPVPYLADIVFNVMVASSGQSLFLDLISLTLCFDLKNE